MGTGLQTLDKQQSLVAWSERISECRSSGMTVKDWCWEHGINPASYYRWQRRLYELSAARTVQFVEVESKPTDAAAAVVHLPGGDVDVYPGIDEETLRTVCRVLSHAQ